MTNFFCEVGSFLSSIFNCCNENRKGPNNPPAPTAKSPSANQSVFDDKEQEIMILILQNYNEVLLKPSKIQKMLLFDGIATAHHIEIKEHIKKWNDDKYYKGKDGLKFHQKFRIKLQEHLQEIKKIDSKDEKNKKFEELLNAISSPKENQDLNNPAMGAKKNLICLINYAKDEKNIGLFSVR